MESGERELKLLGLGCFGVLIFVVLLYIAGGVPAQSFLTLIVSSFFLWSFKHRAETEPDPNASAEAKASSSPPRRDVDPNTFKPARRIWVAFLSALLTASLSATAGVALVVIAQGVLKLSGGIISAQTVADIEYAFASGARQLRALAALPVAWAVVLTLVVVMKAQRQTLVPRFAAARNVIAIIAMALAAATSFTFVSASGANEDYSQRAYGIQAEIRDQQRRTQDAKLEHAAFQTVQASWSALDQAERDATQAALRNTFAGAPQSCMAEAVTEARAETRFIRQPPLNADACRQEFARWIGRRLVPAGDSYQSFETLVFDDPLSPSRLREDRARAVAERREAENARDVVRALVVETFSTVLGPEFSGVADTLVSSMKDAVMAEIARSADRTLVARWSARNTPPPEAPPFEFQALVVRGEITPTETLLQDWRAARTQDRVTQAQRESAAPDYRETIRREQTKRPRPRPGR